MDTDRKGDSMKILVVNDDSIHAPGIVYLAEAAAEFGEVTVVAPAEQCSALSQKLTLREPLTLGRVTDFPAPVNAAYQIDGTPVDCVKVALDYILAEKPDYVFSGINNGYNVGFDIAYSGTLGAAFEAARQGIPAMAFSIAANNHLPFAKSSLVPMIRELLRRDQEPWTVWNVNFPALNKVAYQGILWDCPVATVSLFHEKYIEAGFTGEKIILHNQGIPTENDRIPQGTDAEGVRKGYTTVSRVKCAI